MRTSLFVAVSCLLAGAAQAQDLNVISGVEVKDEGNSVRVTVKGSKPPNFTTFSMADPARFVIDLSESKFQGVPEDQRVDDGVITVVKNLAYGSGANSIARVMVAFTVDVEPPDVRIDGNSLVVTVVRPTGAAAPAVAAASPAAAQAKAEAEERARQEALDREQADREARAQAEAQAQRTREEREAQARADADAKAKAEAAAVERAAREEEMARLAADTRRAAIAAKVAAEAAKTTETPPSAEPSTSAAPPTAPVVAAAPAAVAAAPEPAAPPARTAPAQEAPVVAQARTATPATADALAPPDPAKQAKAEARAEKRARKSIEAELALQEGAEKIAQRVAEVPAPPPAPTLPPARPGKLNSIGFQQLATVSRVFVRTSTPPHYTISDVGDDVVRVELENTRSTRRNDTRPLDTSFFPSNVAMITPSKQGSSYVVDIRLKKRVPYQQKLEGDLLAIDFERPAPASAAAMSGEPEGGAATGAPKAGKRTEATLENEHGMIVTPEEPAAPAGEQPAADGAPASPKQ